MHRLRDKFGNFLAIMFSDYLATSLGGRAVPFNFSKTFDSTQIL